MSFLLSIGKINDVTAERIKQQSWCTTQCQARVKAGSTTEDRLNNSALQRRREIHVRCSTERLYIWMIDAMTRVIVQSSAQRPEVIAADKDIALLCGLLRDMLVHTSHTCWRLKTHPRVELVSISWSRVYVAILRTRAFN